MYYRLGLTAAAYVAAAVAGHALAGSVGLSFVAGLIVADLAWAIRLGIPQAIYKQWKHRNDPPAFETMDYDDYVVKMANEREERI